MGPHEVDHAWIVCNPVAGEQEEGGLLVSIYGVRTLNFPKMVWQLDTLRPRRWLLLLRELLMWPFCKLGLSVRLKRSGPIEMKMKWNHVGVNLAVSTLQFTSAHQCTFFFFVFVFPLITQISQNLSNCPRPTCLRCLWFSKSCVLHTINQIVNPIFIGRNLGRAISLLTVGPAVDL